MVRIRTALALGAAALLAACATGYGPKTLTGGYTDEKLDDTHYRVKFDGNGNATQDRVWSFWIYRCAELTKQQGFTHFALQRPGEPLGQAPGRPPMVSAVYRGDGSSGMIKTKGGGYKYVPMYIPSAPITTWHTDAVVAMYREPLPEYVVVLRAQTVLDQLEPYVRSNGATQPVTRKELYQRAATMNRSESNYIFGGEL